ncbi:thiamine diphosphokinase [Parabacteroides sp. TM07-1AC]|uniref:thiamine diphosphokinase n=1 Tax=Parabacteroides sp. TM07-1AC TaxID=2292363 RepID=UPI000EFF757B|nr:thiamine diphosphokinase [Parabacteroides sp. TM07-1AC]RHU24114.1 thiamine diphosphokinase [Parabacteroides sp. TM07-1AC]
METIYDCVVVANGSFPQTAGPLELLKSAPAIIACDGAVQNLHERGLEPTAIVGDLDSIPQEMLRLYADRIHTVEDQEINDLTKAVRFAHAAGYRKLLILGATGLREDHTLGNISLLMDYAPLFEQVEMLSDYGHFVPVQQTMPLACTPGQQISIFSMYPCGEITTEGLRWPITRRRLTAWWQGSLNEALGNEFTLTLSPEARVIVYFQTPSL